MAPLDDDSTDPPRERATSAGEATLRALEERLGRASEAAERLISEAARAGGAGEAPQTPPSGWAAPGDAPNGSKSETGNDRDGDDLSTIIAFVGSLRNLIPPELQRRLAEALRELLLALRALIDWYLERMEQRRKTPTPVEDIPIF